MESLATIIVAGKRPIDDDSRIFKRPRTASITTPDATKQRQRQWEDIWFDFDQATVKALFEKHTTRFVDAFIKMSTKSDDKIRDGQNLLSMFFFNATEHRYF